VAHAVDPTVWDGKTATSFAAGTGLQSNPYQISTAEQLAFLAQLVNAENETYNASTVFYVLTNDIYLNNTDNWTAWGENTTGLNHWTPIGTNPSKGFAANFNGNGYTVHGIYISTSFSNQGLFGDVTGGKIQNMGINQSYIKGDVAGGVAARIENGRITNCYNMGNVTGNSNVGGITGYINSSAIINCYNAGSISGNNIAGGITGSINGANGRVVNCYNSGSVSGNRYFGSIVGNLSCGCLANCYYLTDTTIDGAGFDDVSEYFPSFDTKGNFFDDKKVIINGVEYTTLVESLNAWVLNSSPPYDVTYSNWHDMSYPKLSVFGATTPVLSSGSVNRTSDTDATIGFTTDEAGLAYYIVVEKGSATPTVAQVQAGKSIGSVAAGAVTAIPITMTAGAKDIYVVVTNVSGSISLPLKIEAAAYTYHVTVNNGQGSGDYESGATVVITAASSYAGQQFKNWTTESAGVTYANENNRRTSFIMPANEVEITANFETVTSVEISDMPLAKVYPNPTGGSVTLQFKIEGVYIVTISDISGKILWQQTVNDWMIQMDISHYSAGVYMLTIDDGKRKNTTRVVKN
jgi:hypothetical protein